MIWVDYFLQVFVSSAATSLAIVVVCVAIVVACKAWRWAAGRMSRPRFLKPGRSPHTGGLS